jgi:hypothetical protein
MGALPGCATRICLSSGVVSCASQIKSAGIANNDDVMFMSGTSCSAPFAAGACAMYLKMNPGSTPLDISANLVRSASSGELMAVRLLTGILPSRWVEKSVATAQAARGWARPPGRHFENQSC